MSLKTFLKRLQRILKDFVNVRLDKWNSLRFTILVLHVQFAFALRTRKKIFFVKKKINMFDIWFYYLSPVTKNTVKILPTIGNFVDPTFTNNKCALQVRQCAADLICMIKQKYAPI